ncbi:MULTISPECIES: hypothetical protein [Enterobacteriaceae]|uniref:Uncharacterized protein n=3 Tax=Klebsiella pneumoniae TaxID=573 RepID=A0A483JXT3_KLEPN|nr:MULTISPECIES: hypothetical protein [Enterobacteriaceae]HDT0764802.1 hypothetical protein [Klebsiella pneumoniae subsp. pneumoniae]EFL6450807.1 hypothetical protein [Escherichia coli]EIW8707967.1 hypothetical protein [Klebsiella pneumoniae]EIW8720211.1 hypothetical protein [Klebsiella pneumoniae]EKU2607762.1 hypothetical protein [Klebsiella pneumoniae]
MTDFQWLVSTFTVIPCILTAGVTWLVTKQKNKKDYKKLIDFASTSHRSALLSFEQMPLMMCVHYLKEGNSMMMCHGIQAGVEAIAGLVKDEYAKEVSDVINATPGLLETIYSKAEGYLQEAARYEEVANKAYNDRKERGIKLPVDDIDTLESLREEIREEGKKLYTALTTDDA